MSTENGTKLKNLLRLPLGIVLQSAWLAQEGYSFDLQRRYRKSNWLESIGTGAMIRKGDKVGYEGALYALQHQTSLSIHPGGRTALSLLGKNHYLEFDTKKVTLFGSLREKLPVWFKEHDWGLSVNYVQTSLLPNHLGMTEVVVGNFSIQVSNAVRAILECLYLVPKYHDLVECYELMEGLSNLRPNEVQLLLEKCNSIKVKRLFLYLAEKASHSWFKYIDASKINLGKGNRSIVQNGVYVPKYHITVPAALEKNETAII
ncbi:MAG: type IV toxin-antitoxin system AbiEi family antitoxin [Phycisphaerales bacterium]|nr:type IV toxin-antitoxin system AbiEi family antitoxin [Phycisphaerales bacterium]